MIILYYESCPNCKNQERNMVREEALQLSMSYDDRYVLALPDIWGKEIEALGGTCPFLYNDETGEMLHLDQETDGMRESIRAFLGGGTPQK